MLGTKKIMEKKKKQFVSLSHLHVFFNNYYFFKHDIKFIKKKYVRNISVEEKA